jgi:tetratricopeptide (TPR) repeat protein
MKRAAAIPLLSLLLTAGLYAQSDVGEVAFANTGSPEAQPAFLRGLALLHDFEYPSAAASFREAQKIDPDFVMAYWGEAMTYTHPVWFQQDLEAARAALGRLGPTATARAARARTERERDYLQTIEVLYGEGSKDDRDVRYSAAMAVLHDRYPNDVDATAFYALSLLGTSHNGRDFSIYMRAAAVLEEVFPTHQHHPGVLHYLIHSYDDPVHAPLGMRAARLYGAVAPNAGHALHMTSHIFVALGMWDEVIDANQRAIAVVNRQRAEKGMPPLACGHYPIWLHYALVQQHRLDEAGRILETCRADALDPNNKRSGFIDTAEGRIESWAEMVASQVMSGGPLTATSAAAANAPAGAKFTLAYAEALDAARRGDRAALREKAAQLRSLQKESSAHMDHMHMGDPSYSQRLDIVLQQVDALQMAAAGKGDDALALLRKAAAAEQSLPFEFGPPFIEKPTLELLGDQLVAIKRYSEAEEAYRAELARAPRRRVALEGLERAKAGASGVK